MSVPEPLTSGQLTREPERSLLARRLVIVTGKGGTGKTTVASALALAAARRGRRVLVAEVGHDEEVPRLLAPDAPPVGYSGAELRPRIRVMRIDPFEALAEYLALQVGAQFLVGRVLKNRGFRQLMSASPGWRELITLGKVWHLERMRDGDRPLYDLIVVDAPATGHGLTFLDVPRVIISAVRSGLLRQHTERVEALIADPARTVLLPVALAEELPARETVELVERVRSKLSIAVDRVVVNRVMPAPFPPDLPRLDEQLSRLPADLVLGSLPKPAALAACARTLRARYELNERHVAEIGERTSLPTIRLPYLWQGVGGIDDLEVLADSLIARETESA